MKRVLHVTVCISAALIMVSFTADVQTDTYTGYAYEEGNTKPVYSEQFTDTFVNGKHTGTVTEYFDPEQKLIAKRVLDFSQSKFAPDFKTEDLRTGYIEGAEVDGENVTLFVKKNKNSPREQKTIAIPRPVVIDGGFNQFIKAHWDELKNGKPLVFYFTVSARLDYFKLRATAVSRTDQKMAVRIEPDRAVVRWLASPITISYDLNTRRILSYEGKSNISDRNGSNFTIKLIYPKKGP